MSTAVFSFGRMNPPTVGHEKLAKKVEAEAKKRKAMPHIYLSHSQDKKKNPLDYNTKISMAKKAFGKMVTKSSSKNIIQIMQELEKMGHTEVVLVVGSDRVPEFKNLLTKYNGKDYNFDSIEVVSAGERDPDAEGVEGMSASKMRAVAAEGDFDTFKSGLPKKLSDGDAKKMYDAIRSVMEDFELTEEEADLDEAPLTIQQRQKRKRLMKRIAPKIQRMKKLKMRKMADADQLKKRAQRKAVMMVKKKVAGEKGQDYANLSPSEKINIDKLASKKMGIAKIIARKMLPKVKKKEMERVSKMRSGRNESFEAFLESAVDSVKKAHEREKMNLKKQHDIEMDAARVKDTLKKNRDTRVNEAFEELFNK